MARKAKVLQLLCNDSMEESITNSVLIRFDGKMQLLDG